MFSKIIPDTAITPVYGYDTYLISTTGNIVDKDTLTPIIFDELSIGKVCFFRQGDLFKRYKLVDLLAINFKQVKEYIPFDLIDQIEGFHIDGDKSNYSLENIGYRFRCGALENPKYPGFYFIPEHLNFGISKDGECINFKTGNLKTGFKLQPSKDKNITGGYIQWRYELGKKQKGIFRHRAMMMVFKEYPNEVDSLQVNHKNGIPGDDYLDNLEWSSPGGNLDHAYRNNLRSQNVETCGYNIITGDFRHYHSFSAAGRDLGYTETTVGNIHNRNKALWVTAEGWTFNPKGVDLDMTLLQAHLNHARQSKKCIGINTQTGERYEFTSYSKAGRFTGLSSTVIGRRISNNDVTPVKGWYFTKTE